MPILQYSTDAAGTVWCDLHPRYLCCGALTRPPRFAPHHPRLDHYLFYSMFRPADLKLAAICGSNPYYLDPHCFTEKLVQRLLRRHAPTWALFGFSRPEGIPNVRYFRHTAWHFSFAPAAAVAGGPQGASSRLAHQGGAPWWRRELLGVGPPIARDDAGGGSSSGGHDEQHAADALGAASAGGVRTRYDQFLHDTLTLHDGAFGFVEPATGAFVPLNKHAVVMANPSAVPPSRSVVEALTAGGAAARGLPASSSPPSPGFSGTGAAPLKIFGW